MTGRKYGSSQFYIDCNYCKKEALFEVLVDTPEGTKEGELCTGCKLWVCHACVNWLESEKDHILCIGCKPVKMKKRLDKLENTCYAYNNNEIKGIYDRR